MGMAAVNRLAESNGHATKRKPRRQRKPQLATAKIAIIGKAPSSVKLAPYNDPEWEIWSLGDNWRNVPRWDRWFELHDLAEGVKRWPKDHVDWLKACPELWVAHPHPDLPQATQYPKNEILSRFFGYFNNSISWMIALAMYERVAGIRNVTDIGLWGVDMAVSDPAQGNNGEYEHQRPSCEFYVGMAAGMGIKMHIPEQSDLLKTSRLYGFETHTGAAFVKLRAREKELKQRQAQAQQKLEQAQQEMLVLTGALQDVAYWKPWLR